MFSTLIYTLISLCAIGVILAVILYIIALKFKVEEDPRIDDIEALLPGANCGGCGFPGCRGFADACVRAATLENLRCPVGGNPTMKSIGEYLGQSVAESAPLLAVVRCNGDCDQRPKTNVYDGAASCAVAATLYAGDTACSYGCLGCGDCVAACQFGAMYMNDKGLPVILEDACTACGACAKACPKLLIEMRPKGPKNRRIYVACRNTDKGGIAKKACAVACTGCTKCLKVCEFEAITIQNYLSYIDPNKCRLCRKCVDVCDTHSILEINFPSRKTNQEIQS